MNTFIFNWREMLKRNYAINKNMVIRYFIFHILFMLLKTVSEVFIVLIPAKVVAMLMGKSTLNEVLIILFIYIASHLLSNALQSYEFMGDMNLRMMDINTSIVQAIDIPSEKMNGKFGKDFFDASTSALFAGNEQGSEAFTRSTWRVLSSLLSILTFIYMSKGLPIILLPLVIIPAIISAFTKNKFNNFQLSQYDKIVKYSYRFRDLEKSALQENGGKDQRIFNLKKVFEKKFLKNKNDFVSTLEKESTYRRNIQIINKSVAGVINLACIYILFNQFVLSGNIDSFLLYFGIINQVTRLIENLIENILEVDVNGKKFKSFNELMSEKKYYEGDFSKKIPIGKIEVELKDVSFSYDGKYNILDNLNLKIKEGEKIALVGENGAGKTTLVKIMTGLLTPQRGEVLINGINIKDVNPKEVYDRITLVFQEPYIMATSVLENITLSEKRDTDNQKLNKVLNESGLVSKVESLPLGLDTQMTTYLDPMGVEFSGGQNQRLMLARALYKGGDLLILDEPTSALDPIAESLMYQEYLKYTQNKTSVFISHRLASTNFCDRVFLLDKGKVLAHGSHKELLETSKEYKEMWDTQSRYYKGVEGDNGK